MPCEYACTRTRVRLRDLVGLLEAREGPSQFAPLAVALRPCDICHLSCRLTTSTFSLPQLQRDKEPKHTRLEASRPHGALRCTRRAYRANAHFPPSNSNRPHLVLQNRANRSFASQNLFISSCTRLRTVHYRGPMSNPQASGAPVRASRSATNPVRLSVVRPLSFSRWARRAVLPRKIGLTIQRGEIHKTDRAPSRLVLAIVSRTRCTLRRRQRTRCPRTPQRSSSASGRNTTRPPIFTQAGPAAAWPRRRLDKRHQARKLLFASFGQPRAARPAPAEALAPERLDGI